MREPARDAIASSTKRPTLCGEKMPRNSSLQALDSFADEVVRHRIEDGIGHDGLPGCESKR